MACVCFVTRLSAQYSPILCIYMKYKNEMLSLNKIRYMRTPFVVMCFVVLVSYRFRVPIHRPSRYTTFAVAYSVGSLKRTTRVTLRSDSRPDVGPSADKNNRVVSLENKSLGSRGQYTIPSTTSPSDLARCGSGMKIFERSQRMVQRRDEKRARQ